MQNKYTPEQIRKMILGLNTPVKLHTGKLVPAINLDNAATTPPFKVVADEIKNQLLHYGSIGRGLGQKSVYSSKVYEDGRKTVLDFVGADSDKYDVFYVNCTTDGMNKLASALIESPKDMVLSTRMEHHANDLPWRERAQTVYVDVDADGRLKIDDYESILEAYENRIKLVTVAAASNVTGYVNDVHRIAAIAHRHGAKIIVDGAQIVAHREFRMKADNPLEDIDFFVFSAHKMYSPYGGGAVVGLKDVLNERLPIFYGGGMVDEVTDYTVRYSEMPNRFEAGSPNYPGVVGMLKAMEILKDIGFDYIVEHEQSLLRRALDGLRKIDGVLLYGDSKNISDRVGLLVFNIENMKNEMVAQQLADKSAIAVRHAKFCAHTYVQRLLKKYAKLEADNHCVNNGMVRVSFGIYNNKKDVDALIRTVKGIIAGDIAPEIYVETSNAMRMPNDRG